MTAILPRNRQADRGFTLIELAIVLLVAGVVLGAIWVAAAKTWDNYRVYRIMQQLTRVTQNIREYYMNAQQLAGGDITAVLDGQNLFPQEMRRNPGGGAGGAIDHPLNTNWPNGSFHVAGLVCPAPAPAQFTCFRVRMQGVTPSACIGLLTAVPVSDADLGIVRVGTQNMGGGTSTTNVTTSVNASTAEGWCNQAGANNEVDWDFRLRN